VASEPPFDGPPPEVGVSPCPVEAPPPFPPEPPAGAGAACAPCCPAALEPADEAPTEAPAPVEPVVPEEDPDRDGGWTAGAGSTIRGPPPPPEPPEPPEPPDPELSGTKTGCGQIPAPPPLPWATRGTEV
jgi:hypothetical protein